MRIFGIKTSTIFALLFLTIAAYHLFATLLFLRVAIPTVAIVEGQRNESVTARTESRYGSRQDTYNFIHRIIKFHATNGNEYELSKPTPFGSYEEGQRIDILYDPEHPEKSRQKSIGAMWGTCIFFSFFSFVFFLYRLSIVIKEHRARQIKQASSRERRR